MTQEQQLEQLVQQIRDLYAHYGTDLFVQAIARYRQEIELERQEQDLTNKVVDITEKLEKVKRQRRKLRTDDLVETKLDS